MRRPTIHLVVHTSQICQRARGPASAREGPAGRPGLQRAASLGGLLEVVDQVGHVLVVVIRVRAGRRVACGK